MAKCLFIQLFLFLTACHISSSDPDSARGLDFRSGRSLTATFPFNRGHDHHAHHAHHDIPDGHISRQGADGGAEVEEEGPLDLGSISAAGERCVEKVMMVEETVYDNGIECHHSYDKRCHTTYKTDYVPEQIEVCDENFVKECHIEYKDVAFNETVEVCNERPVRDCAEEGPTVCETVYESECATTYHVHDVEDDTPNCRIMMVEKCHEVTQGYSTTEECDKWPKQVCELEKKNVKKYSPETQCKKKPREVCGPGPCPLVAGPKECRDEVKTVVQEVPEETCSLRAQPYCEFETKLVPVLKPMENCVDVPKEVCVRVRRNPRRVKRPIIKKWCYVPSEESGLKPTTTTELPVEVSSSRLPDATSETPTTTTTTTLAPPPPPQDPPTLYAAPVPPPPEDVPTLYEAPPVINLRNQG